MSDKTQDLLNHIKSQFIGHRIDQPLMTYQDHTRERDLIVGSVRYGWRLMAKGWAEVTELKSNSGTISVVEVGDYRLWVTKNFKMTFGYKSWTRGEKWVEPGGARVDYPWKDLHPEGELIVSLNIEPQKNGALYMHVTVKPGHDDRPNNFIKDVVASRFIGRLDSTIESFTGVNINSAAD